MELNENTHVFFPGIDQVGVSALARFLHQMGVPVSGSAPRRSAAVTSLQGDGVEVSLDADASNLVDADLVVMPPEIGEGHVELTAARDAGMSVVPRSKVLSALLPGYRTIGVTGTHGKGTVASMIAWILECAGWEPGFIIGGWLQNFDTNARLGAGEWLVVEIDESDGTHHGVHCDYVICNFLELDHLTHYEGLEDIIATMIRFLESNDRLKEAFVNLDCLGNRQLVTRAALRPTGYARDRSTEFRAEITGSGQLPIPFRAYHRDLVLGDFELNLPGRYNVVNALGALALAWRLGVEERVIAEALKSYESLKDRYSIARGGGVTIVKDYTSHPTGIRQVLHSARDLTTGRIYSVFKPYHYSMIESLQDQYGSAFDASDEVIVTKMYAAGDDPIPGIGTETVVEKIRAQGTKVTYLPKEEKINEYLLQVLAIDDKVIFFGGEDLLEQADHLQAELASRAAQTPPEAEQPRLDGPLTKGE